MEAYTLLVIILGISGGHGEVKWRAPAIQVLGTYSGKTKCEEAAKLFSPPYDQLGVLPDAPGKGQDDSLGLRTLRYCFPSPDKLG